jgi:hypothetical protein
MYSQNLPLADFLVVKQYKKGADSVRESSAFAQVMFFLL